MLKFTKIINQFSLVFPTNINSINMILTAIMVVMLNEKLILNTTIKNHIISVNLTFIIQQILFFNVKSCNI